MGAFAATADDTEPPIALSNVRFIGVKRYTALDKSAVCICV
jgi:hypothetical protein